MFTDISATIFVWEFVGTAILLLLGNGVGAAVTLASTKSYKAGWLAISFGWGLAIFVATSLADRSGAHLNPVVTLALAIKGSTEWKYVPVYIVAQLLGAMCGAFICWLAYKKEFEVNKDPEATLGIFATIPQNRSYLWNTVSEIIATFVLVFFLLEAPAKNSSLGYAAVAFLIISISFSVGSNTGYAINPARDFGPRLVHSLLPLKNKRDSDWSYSFVPILGPVIGALLAAFAFKLLDGYDSVPVALALQLLS